MKIFRLISTALLLLAFSLSGYAGPHDNKVRKLLQSEAAKWLSSPLLIESIKRQNNNNANLTQRQIDKLDKDWRKQRKSSERPMIDEVMSNELSRFLKGVESNGNGLYSEIFVMDNKGLNVGQSQVTSDYWQGDEAKWQKTYMSGANALHIGKIEYDESARGFLIQASVSVVDPTTKNTIGAVTIGLSMRQLALRRVE